MRKDYKKLLMGVTATVLGGTGGMAHASAVASDMVSNNPPYSGYNAFSGLNGGSGFGAWNVTASSTNTNEFGDFMWNSVDLTTAGAAQGFDIYCNGTQNAPTAGAVTDTITAIRPFTGALAANQTFSFVDQLNNGSNPTNGGPSNLGFSLEDSSGNALFDFHAQGGSNYFLTDATQTATPESNVPYNYHQIDTFSFTLNSVSATTAAYTLVVSGDTPAYAGGVPLSPQTFTGTISMLTGGISQVAIYNNNGGEGSDVQFDYLSISNVPEPVSLGGLAVVGLGTMIRRRR
jgi:hypothetical protein